MTEKVNYVNFEADLEVVRRIIINSSSGDRVRNILRKSKVNDRMGCCENNCERLFTRNDH